MYITVVGGGNSTAIFATQAKLAGHDVAILTRKPEEWEANRKIGFVNEDETYLEGAKEFSAVIDLITKDPGECIPQSDMVFIAGLPIHFNRDILNQIKPHLALKREKPVFVGTICAYGGFNWLVADVLGEGNYVICGTQVIPWTCGTIKYGHTGVVFGKKLNLRVVTESGKDEHGLKKIFNDILHLPNISDSDFMTSTLWPNNPSVHPPILYALFKDWNQEEKQTYELGSPEAPVLIYAEANQTAADYIGKLNEEQKAIVKALSGVFPDHEHLKDPGFDYMASLIYAYGKDNVVDSSSIMNALRSTKAYKKHKIPYVVVENSTEPEEKKQKVENGEKKEKVMVMPNVDHKFYTTDLPYGLCTYKDIALMLGVETPFIDEIMYWNQKLVNKEYLVDGKLTGKDIGECILPSKFGLTKDTLDQGNRKN